MDCLNVLDAAKNKLRRAALHLLLALSIAATLGFAFVANAAASTPQGGVQPLSMTPSPTPQGAVHLAVERLGAVYAGDCATTRSPQDLGDVCSKLAGQKDGMRAYLVGRTFAEFSAWLFLRHTSAGWSAVSIAPLDFTAASLTIPWPASS